jgi:probable F420-dependent oxidoreductase
VKFGIALASVHPAGWCDVTAEADRLGIESVWIPEHLVLPAVMSGSPFADQAHPPIPPTTPVFDVLGYLCFLAGRTERIRLGTFVYNLALRHPFVAARGVQTLDVVSGGRAELGIGAGWLREEWEAAGLDFHTRGRRLDEAIEVCRRLWHEPEVEHHGEFFDFPAVAFEPKPVQASIPLHIGGESEAALERAARSGDGWMPMSEYTPESVAVPVARLRELRVAHGHASDPFMVTVGAGDLDAAVIARWEDAGVGRLLVSPWVRSREAIDGLQCFAKQFL